MSRLMIFGLCPLPLENTIKSFGPGIRAWQFIKPLLADGHELCLASFRIPFIYPPGTPAEVYTEEYGFPFYAMDQALFENPAHLGPIVERFAPEAMIAITIFATRGAIKVRKHEPFWIDLFGHVMAEAQAKANRYESDEYLQHFWSHERDAIAAGDVFSTVSTPQMYATIGELGALGRLNRFTTGYQFTHVIPCAADETLYTHDRTVMRGSLVKEDDFVVLWSGGYNTWTDVDTLFAALIQAMSANPHVHYVSTGGAIDGHDERTYACFQRLIANSPFRERFHMLGWLPKQEVHNYYFEADVGINIDKYMYEGMFGSKNRVLDWMRAGLPALVGELCELSYTLSQKGIGFSYPLNDPQALAGSILELAAHPERLRAAGDKARGYAVSELSFSATTAPVREWAAHPSCAPDVQRSSRFDEPAFLPQERLSAEYQSKLEGELGNRAGHQRTLEKYIRHLEQEIRIRDSYHPLDYLRLGYYKLRNPQPVRATPFNALPVNPKASIIIVTHNGAAYLHECLNAVLALNYPDFEVLVVDNASSDGSADLAAQEFPTVRLVRNESNRGFAAANNQGIAAAAGDIIALLNQDTRVEAMWLKELVQALVVDPTIGIVGCKMYHADGITLQHAGGIMHDNALTDHRGAGQKDEGQFNEPADVAYVTGAAIAFRRELIVRIGVFDEDYKPAYFEELDFCLRTRNQGYRIRYIPTARLIHYESTASGKFSEVFFYRYHRNRIRFVLKNFGVRDYIPRFIAREIRWILKHLPEEQKRPLLRAYRDNVLILPATLRARLSERRRMRWRRRGDAS